jgi:hypothetical protein
MNRVAAFVAEHLPAACKRRQLRALTAMVAAAFDLPTPRRPRGSYEHALAQFAEFTHACVMDAQRRGAPLDETRQRLYCDAFALGRRYGHLLGVRGMDDLMRACGILYRVLGIDFRGDRHGAIVIRSCSFSARYTAETCRVMSAMDAGILAGMAGGGSLRFSARLTEGGDACHACFERVGGTTVSGLWR